MELEIVDVKIEAVVNRESKRLAQIFLDGTIQSDFCVHGLTFRWHCDGCEEPFHEPFKLGVVHALRYVLIQYFSLTRHL